MKKAVILAAGRGKKIWPYGEVRPKVLIPIAGKPLVSYLVNNLLSLGVQEILIAASTEYSGDISSTFKINPEVRVAEVPKSEGTADTLLSALDGEDCAGTGVFYGDTLIHPGDLKSFISPGKEGLRVLLTSQAQRSSPGRRNAQVFSFHPRLGIFRLSGALPFLLPHHRSRHDAPPGKAHRSGTFPLASRWPSGFCYRNNPPDS